MSYFIYFVLASVLTFLLTPFAARLAVRIGAVDVPDGVRKIHTRTTPYGGGIAMFVAFLLTFCVSVFHYDLEINGKLISLVAASVIMLLIGLFDDIRPIDAKYKFLVQIGAASVLYVAGYRISHISGFSGMINFDYWSIPITLFWITGVTNTINLIDGLDGLAAGIAAIASTTIFVISFITGNTDAALFAAILAGACVGFLPRNLNNRTKVFMGDAGAYFVGMILAIISMEGGLKSATFLTVVAPVLAVGIPIFDTAFAILRRLFNGKPIGQPDRGHLHHRLVDIGISHKKTVLALYFINVVFGMGAVAIINGDLAYGAMFFVIAFILVLIPSFRTPSSNNATSDIVLSKIRKKSDKPRVLAVFGTRPEVIKMAPLILQMKKSDAVETLVCVTGQHREQMDQMLDVFQLIPDVDLNLMKKGQTLAEITSRTVRSVDRVIAEVRPDLVLVHGDPSASFAAALSAFYRQVPIGHVEAGLRSGNIHSPFPEEYNRRSTGLIADLHFAATEANKNFLLSEGVDADKIFVTGNTAIDAVFSVLDESYRFEEEKLAALDFTKKIIVMTAHRRENLGERMRAIFTAVRRIADEFEDVHIVYAVHLNPLIQDLAHELLSEHERISLLKPLGYRDMCNLMARSYMVVTDSGGLQEEAPALGKPVVLMRTETERQEAIEAGTVVLAGVEEESVYQNIRRILTDEEVYKGMATAKNPYGDGHTSEYISAIIEDYFKNKNGQKNI